MKTLSFKFHKITDEERPLESSVVLIYRATDEHTTIAMYEDGEFFDNITEADIPGVSHWAYIRSELIALRFDT